MDTKDIVLFLLNNDKESASKALESLLTQQFETAKVEIENATNL